MAMIRQRLIFKICSRELFCLLFIGKNVNVWEKKSSFVYRATRVFTHSAVYTVYLFLK